MKEVSIVGRSNGYEHSFKAEGEIWVVSSAFKLLHPDKVDLIFQLHKPDVWESWLPEESERVVTAFPGKIVKYRNYPVEYMLKKYGPVFGSSVSWMIALAIEEKFEKINIFGCDLASKEEYINQRDTFFYMCGRAEALGIEINIPEDSRSFYKDRIYGVM